METSIKLDTDGWFEIRTTEEVSLEWRNRFNAPINRRKIITWTQDNHVRTNLLVKEGQFFLEMCYKIEECRKTTISSLQKISHDLVNFVDCLPEVDSTIEDDKIEDDNKSKEQNQEEIVDFVTDVLVGLHEKEISGAVLMTSVGPIGLPCGKISHKVLTQMFETWLDKYGNK